MARTSVRRDEPFALGFRVKSGYAIAVAIAGPADAPVPLIRRVVELSDPGVEATRQPYHDGFGTAQEDTRAIERLTAIVERAAMRSIATLLADELLTGRRCPRAGLVVGSLIDPDTVGNLHIRAHAHEGRLFRMVVERALRQQGVASSVTVEKTLTATAVRTLGRSPREIAAMTITFGRSLGKPWRTEEKSAATAAWMALV